MGNWIAEGKVSVPGMGERNGASDWYSWMGRRGELVSSATAHGFTLAVDADAEQRMMDEVRMRREMLR